MTATLASFLEQRAAEQPVAGKVLTALGAPLSYVTRKSALNQADCWNTLMAESLPAGFTVGIGDRVDGRYPLVWVETAAVTA